MASMNNGGRSVNASSKNADEFFLELMCNWYCMSVSNQELQYHSQIANFNIILTSVKLKPKLNWGNVFNRGFLTESIYMLTKAHVNNNLFFKPGTVSVR